MSARVSATTALVPRPALSQLGTLELTVREGRIQQLAMLLEPRLAAAACAPLPGLKCKSTLLHVACDLGQTTCAQLLVKWAPAMQHARTRVGSTPLLLCCGHGHANHCEGVRILVKAGAALDVQRKSDGASAAHLCAEAGCAQCLRLLLTKAPQLVDAKDRKYLSVLHAAAACDKRDAPACVSLLLREGAQLEACSSTVGGTVRPLQLACLRGRHASVRLLLMRRADVNARDAQRRTALHHACAAGRHTVVEALLRAGAEPNALDAQGGAPIQAAVKPLLLAAASSSSTAQAGAGAAGATAAAAAAAVHDAELGGARPPPPCAWCGARGCAWEGVAQRAELIASLIEAGAPVGVRALRQLRIGCHEQHGARGGSAGGGGGGRGVAAVVPSLYELSQRALCNSLVAEDVLPGLKVAAMLGATRLSSECERMVVINHDALVQGGAFEGEGVEAGALLRQILTERVAHLVSLRHADVEAVACCACPPPPLEGRTGVVDGDEDEDEDEDEGEEQDGHDGESNE